VAQKLTVYQIRNIKTGKVYIGQTSRPLNIRWNTHLCRAKRGDNPGMRFYDALREEGRNGFIVSPLVIVGTRAEAERLEEYFIIVLNADQEASGYNMRRGRSYEMPESHRVKIGNANRGVPKSPEHIAKCWASRKLNMEHLRQQARAPASDLVINVPRRTAPWRRN
jgi:GIY-YIG catalytic domain